ncbi:MAG TPA: nitrogen regulation protein NR(II) [Burkholderiales bacterium]|nr:nitrogen regulation protein NR(II) [Burkholderiales bacterium]
MTTRALYGLDLLATAVVLVDGELAVHYMNPAAENLFEASSKSMAGVGLEKLLPDSGVLNTAIAQARASNSSYTEHDLELRVGSHSRLHVSCTVTPLDLPDSALPDDMVLLEIRLVEQQVKIAREERMLNLSQASRELIRNLAHEIKNPLGGIRGAAQLLDRELERPALHEYTQVIMKEADRLQSLMDRMLTPHRLPRAAPLNIHEVLERVRSLIIAEFPRGITIDRDYDVSLPVVVGDMEQLIQAVLNVARNAAQAIMSKDAKPRRGERGRIALRTRVVRQVTLARRRYRHVIAVDIWDNGPGISEELRERVFHPLVSGREGGSGLGLTLAQTFVTQHHGLVSFESAPGNTCFTILIPATERDEGGGRRAEGKNENGRRS